MKIVLFSELFPIPQSKQEWESLDMSEFTHYLEYVVESNRLQLPVRRSVVQDMQNGVGVCLYPDIILGNNSLSSYGDLRSMNYDFATIKNKYFHSKQVTSFGKIPKSLILGHETSFHNFCAVSDRVFGTMICSRFGRVFGLTPAGLAWFTPEEIYAGDFNWKEYVIPDLHRFPIRHDLIKKEKTVPKKILDGLPKIWTDLYYKNKLIVGNTANKRHEYIPLEDPLLSDILSLTEEKEVLSFTKSMYDPRIYNIQGLYVGTTHPMKSTEYHDCVGNYHQYQRQQNARSDAKFLIGLEIEKEDREMQVSTRHEMFNKLTQWYKERDGSLDDTGFEIVSPIFNLNEDKILAEFENDILEDHINAKYSQRCGGHINISDTHSSITELFVNTKGYFPLLYALYPNRIRNNQSQAKKIHEYYGSDKYCSVYIRKHRLEFRIFPAVANVEELKWRIKFMRYICANLGKTEHEIYTQLKDSDSELYSLLSEYIETKYFGNILYAKQLKADNVPGHIKGLVGKLEKYALKYNDYDLKNNKDLGEPLPRQGIPTSLEDAVRQYSGWQTFESRPRYRTIYDPPILPGNGYWVDTDVESSNIQPLRWSVPVERPAENSETPSAEPF